MKIIGKKTKKFYYKITTFPGIKFIISERILCSVGFNKNAKLNNIDEKNSTIFIKILEKFLKDFNLAKTKATELQFIKKKIKNKNYKGRRHLNALPVRGQNSRTNSQTQKSKKTRKRKLKKTKKNKNKF